MTLALIFVAALLLVGVVLRQNVALFRLLYIPASVVAGLVGLVIIQVTKHFAVSQGTESTFSLPEIATGLSGELSSWPGWLIAVVFAGMLLEKRKSVSGKNLKRVGQQGLMVWIIVLGQTAIGLLATWMIVQQMYDVPNSFGMLIETGFAGGHGTAAAMGQVFKHDSIGFPAGLDLGLMMATCGLVSGIVTGILWINVGVRLGWVPRPSRGDTETAANEVSEPIGFAKIDKETIDPLLLQVIWLAMALGLGMLMQSLVLSGAGVLDGMFNREVAEGAEGQLAKRLTISNVADFPLFIYTLFGGLLVSKILYWFGQSERVDGASINRLTSTAMDVLVVAAVASLNIQAVTAMAVPFLILFLVGSVWSAICLLVISRLILPREHWFQLGLINYGMSTGTTATGFVLLRMVDPDLETSAAEDYALAAPISAPFVGGGMITIALPLLLLEWVHIGIPAAVISLVVLAMIVAGIRWNKPNVE